jgi:hypothetical protein
MEYHQVYIYNSLTYSGTAVLSGEDPNVTVSAPASYSVGPEFKSQSGQRLSWRSKKGLKKGKAIPVTGREGL